MTVDLHTSPIGVAPTGRWPHGAAAGELEVDVATGHEGELTLEDGTTIRVADDAVRITGPRRDVLVLADGRPVQRVRGDDVTVDLWAAAQRTSYDPAASAAALEADAARLPRHDHRITPAAPGPGEPVEVSVWADPDTTGGTIRLTTDGSDPLGVAATTVPLAPASDHGATGRWTATVPGQADGTWVRYAIDLEDGDGRTTPVDDAAPGYLFPLPGVTFHRPSRRRFSYAVHTAEPPSWAADAVVHHVLVDRFAGPGGAPVALDGPPPMLGFLGGTIDGLIARLDHIAALGATALLVSCLTECDMHVGYDAVDTMAVDPRFGTEDDVRRLCDEAHRRGLRVLLDHEASYAGGRNPAVVAARRDPSGAEAAWFLHDPGTGRLLGWYGGNPTFVPFDHDHPDVREHLLDAARWWLRLGVDGFRLDSAHAASLDLWAAFGRAVRAGRPDALTFGEVTSSLADAVRLEGRLGGLHDFGLQGALRGFAGDGTVPPSELDAVVSERDAVPPSLVRLTFVECHDGDRFSHLAGGDDRRLLLALGLLLTLPGTPLLLYGTEVGLAQPSAGDPELVVRLPMPWGDDQDTDLLAAVTALVERRRRTPALRRGGRETVLVDDDRCLYAFRRHLGDDSVLVVANGAEANAHVELPGAGPLRLPPLSLTVKEVPTP